VRVLSLAIVILCLEAFGRQPVQGNSEPESGVESHVTMHTKARGMCMFWALSFKGCVSNPGSVIGGNLTPNAQLGSLAVFQPELSVPDESQQPLDVCTFHGLCRVRV
jgi:hypothetical protein